VDATVKASLALTYYLTKHAFVVANWLLICQTCKLRSLRRPCLPQALLEMLAELMRKNIEAEAAAVRGLLQSGPNLGLSSRTTLLILYSELEVAP